jgi:hypothetical protein
MSVIYGRTRKTDEFSVHIKVKSFLNYWEKGNRTRVGVFIEDMHKKESIESNKYRT